MECTLLGRRLARIRLNPFEASALAKLRFALIAAEAPERLAI
jgi:hypothetical protein